MVGYLNNQNYVHGSMKLMTPCFANVGDGQKVTLKDITVSGYKNPDGSYIEGCDDGVEAAVEIAMLNTNGGTKKVDGENVIYYWFDTPEKPAGWYDINANPMTEEGGSLWGDAAKIEFKNGNGFRVMISENYYDGEGELVPFAINFNGEVLKGDVEITTYTAGSMKPAGNPLPVSVKLSQLTVTGYTDDQGQYIEGCEDGVEAAFEIAAINANGGTKKVDGENVIYYWFDTPEKPAGWYDINANPMTADGGSLWGDAAKIEYKACDGFRVLPSENYYDGEGEVIQFNLKFPSCID